MKGSVIVLISLLRGEISQNEYMDYNSIKVIETSLPRRVYGFIFNYRNMNLIIINKSISKEKYDQTLLHEFAHFELNHIYKLCFDFKIEGIEDEADQYVKFLQDLILEGENLSIWKKF